MQTNCTAIAKLQINAKLKMYRLVFSFDTHNKITVKNCVLATGDICATNAENWETLVAQEIQKAKAVLRTNNIVLAD